MELANQIKKLRNEKGMSQEDLAEKIFVSRQTISNWENDKNYPDLKSLLLLSECFEVSLDQLVKGDLEEMKERIETQDVKGFKALSVALEIEMVVLILSALPLLKYAGWQGIAIWALFFVITMGTAVRIELIKKALDIRTYREITAYMEGKELEEEEKQQEKEKGNNTILKMLFGAGVALILILLEVFIVGLIR